MFKFYGKFWLATKEQLNDLRLREKAMQMLEQTSDRTVAHRLFASMYARYVILCNSLSELYDQTMQVQKRGVLLKLLEAATLRLLDLQQEMMNVELSQFLFIDEEIKEMHYVPQDITLLRPLYFPRDRREDIKEILGDTYAPKGVVVGKPEEMASKRASAVLLIQRHARAQQGRRKHMNYQPAPRATKTQFKMPTPRISTDKYQSPPEYSFYHKQEQVPLIPVKRTELITNFCQQLHSISEYSFYKTPDQVDPKAVLRKEALKVAMVEFEFLLDPKRVTQKSAEEIIDKYALKVCPVEPVNVDRGNHIKIEVQLKERSSEVFVDIDELKEEEKRMLERKWNEAAWIIQRNWLKFKLKKLVRLRLLRKLEYLGIIPDDDTGDEVRKLEKTLKYRRSKKQLFDEEFTKAVLDERARIVKVRSPFIIEDISDSIRDWFQSFYNVAKSFDRYPEEFMGGTIMVLRGETMTPEEYLINMLKTKEQRAEEKQINSEILKELKRQQKELKKEMKLRIKERKMQEAEGYQVWPFKYPENIPASFINLDETMADYEREWMAINEIENVKEKPIMEFITADEMQTQHLALRKQVDNYMRLEHELLRMALAEDEKKKYKPQVNKTEKNKKKGKKKKIKQEEEERSTQDMLEELRKTKIIKTYQHRSLDDFIADHNYIAQDLRLKNENPSHCAADVVYNIRNFLVGMGNLDLPQTKSMLFAGPPLTGKKFLVEAMCSETDAILFDISPENTTHISEDNAEDFLSLVLKVAKILEPSIILVNNVHKVFYSKIPKTEAHLPDPRTFKKILFKKLIKKINPEDRVIVLGCSNDPAKGKTKLMKKAFEKFLFLPVLDYGCTFFSWWKSCSDRKYISKFIDVAPIAAVTKGTTTGTIIKTLDNVLHAKRRIQLSRYPLCLEELLENMMSVSPSNVAMPEKEYQKYLKFYQKVDPTANKRKKVFAPKQKK